MMKWDNKLNAINSISQLHFCSSTWVKDILCLNTFGQLIIDWFPHEISIFTSCLSETRCCYGFHTWLLTNSPKFVKKLIDISGSCKPGFPDSLIECDMTVFIKFNTLTLFERRLSKTFSNYWIAFESKPELFWQVVEMENPVRISYFLWLKFQPYFLQMLVSDISFLFVDT